MTYVITGLCGSLEKYEEMKKAAGIRDDDTVYIIGGAAQGDLSLLCELSMCANVYPVMAKADYSAAKLLGGFERALKSGESPDPKFISEMQKWMADGGSSVLEAFRGFDADMKDGILDYLSDFTLFEEAEVNGKEFILLSAGITGYNKGTDLYDLEPQNFMSRPLDLDKKYADGKIMITASAKQENDKITRVGDNISMDCKKGACLRLEDLAEFYA